MWNAFIQMQIYGQEFYPNAIVFLNMFLIPERVGKFFSKEKHIQILDNTISEKVCYCGGEGSGELFPCFKRQ